MSMDVVVNKGMSSWDIVTDSKPGAALATSWCNAAPDVDDWQTLSEGKTNSFRDGVRRKLPKIPGKVDAEGHTIDIQWRIWWQYASQYRGRGKFIRTVWIELLKCDVVPKFDVRVEFRAGKARNDNPNPGWPAAILDIGTQVTVTTPKWQKPLDQRLYELHYTGYLTIK